MTTLLPAASAILSFIFAIALFDQWRERRHGYQLVWAIGMLLYGLASACEALGAAGGWNDGLYRAWYLSGVVLSAGWLGLGTALLLGRTRFGYAFAFCLLGAGFIMFALRNSPKYADAGNAPIIYFVIAVVVALAIFIETYFQNERWPLIAALAVVGVTLIGAFLVITANIAPPGYALNPDTNIPVGDAMPAALRLLTPFMNVTGGGALVLGAIFSAYVFMPKKRVLAYSLDPAQKFDQFLFNLIISPVALIVNFVASLPGTVRAWRSGGVNSRVPATLLIAIGGILAGYADSFNRLGATQSYSLLKFLTVVFLFVGFLVSIEVFQVVRIPFTGIVLRSARSERVPAIGPTEAG
ncbi:MAG: hypothetical protein ACRDF7_05160 [Candidatus Limnocylindrales bacterium]